jgi:hypothetical protein
MARQRGRKASMNAKTRRLFLDGRFAALLSALGQAERIADDACDHAHNAPLVDSIDCHHAGQASRH